MTIVFHLLAIIHFCIKIFKVLKKLSKMLATSLSSSIFSSFLTRVILPEETGHLKMKALLPFRMFCCLLYFYIKIGTKNLFLCSPLMFDKIIFFIIFLYNFVPLFSDKYFSALILSLLPYSTL